MVRKTPVNVAEKNGKMERTQNPLKITRHHLLFYDQEWSLRPEGKFLRCDGGLIAPLTRLDHNRIHDEVALVPLLGVYALKRVAAQYEPGPSLYKNIDQFASLVDEAIHHPRSHSLEKRLGELTIESMIMQRDFIKEIRKKS